MGQKHDIHIINIAVVNLRPARVPAGTGAVIDLTLLPRMPWRLGICGIRTVNTRSVQARSRGKPARASPSGLYDTEGRHCLGKTPLPLLKSKTRGKIYLCHKEDAGAATGRVAELKTIATLP